MPEFKFKLPDIGEGISEAEVIEWLAKKGDKIKKDQDLVKIETAKAVVDLPSPVNGKLLEIKAKKGETIKVGGVLAVIDTKEKVREKKEEKFGVVGDIPGAEKGNIFAAAKQQEKKEKAKVKKKYDFYGHIKRAEVKGIRKATIENLGKTKDYLLVTAMDDADVTELWDIRKEKKKEMKVKLTFLPYIIKACVGALKDQPMINTSLENDEIIIKEYYNIGVAVALEGEEGGLIVPVVKGADQKNITKLAKEIKELAEKGKKRKLDMQELKGGSFTITNYGSIGGTYGTPLPNPPESSILGLGRIYESGGRKLLPLSLTFDHRIVDGAIASLFLNKVKELLSDKKWIEKREY